MHITIKRSCLFACLAFSLLPIQITSAAVPAKDVLNAVSAENSASADAKILMSKLEITAGADRLFAFSDLSSQVALFAEIRYRLSTRIQFGGSLALRYQGIDRGADMAVQALLGPTFNFVSDGESDATGAVIQNAFFVSPKIGPGVSRTTLDHVVVESSARITFSLSAGKRFALGKGIAYSPSIAAVAEGGPSLGFVVQPIALSIFF